MSSNTDSVRRCPWSRCILSALPALYFASRDSLQFATSIRPSTYTECENYLAWMSSERSRAHHRSLEPVPLSPRVAVTWQQCHLLLKGRRATDCLVMASWFALICTSGSGLGNPDVDHLPGLPPSSLPEPINSILLCLDSLRRDGVVSLHHPFPLHGNRICDSLQRVYLGTNFPNSISSRRICYQRHSRQCPGTTQR